jgi:hypothetical protein
VVVGEMIISCISIPELEIYYLKNFKFQSVRLCGRESLRSSMLCKLQYLHEGEMK